MAAVEAGSSHNGVAWVALLCDGEDSDSKLTLGAFDKHCTSLEQTQEKLAYSAAPAPGPRSGKRRVVDAKVQGAPDTLAIDDAMDPLMNARLSLYWPGDRRSYEGTVVERRVEVSPRSNREALRVQHRVEYTEPKLHYFWHDLGDFEYEVLAGPTSAGDERTVALYGQPQGTSTSASLPSAPPHKALKRARKLRAVEWFAGSGRLSFALMSFGWECVLHDHDPNAIEWEQHGAAPGEGNTYWSDDFLEIERRSLLNSPPYDFMHFSVECSSFSGLSRGVNRRMPHNNFCGETAACQQGSQMLSHALDLINDQLLLNPSHLFTLENPRGDMHKHPLVVGRLELPRKDGGLGAVRCLINYCMFADAREDAYLKPTHFWTNCEAIIRTLGADQALGARGAPPPQFVCSSSQACCGRRHTPVCGNTKAATPFPEKLAATLALLVNAEAAQARFRGCSH